MSLFIKGMQECNIAEEENKTEEEEGGDGGCGRVGGGMGGR